MDTTDRNMYITAVVKVWSYRLWRTGQKQITNFINLLTAWSMLELTLYVYAPLKITT